MINQIREQFASLKIGKSQRVEQNGIFIDAWVYRSSLGYGVAIPYEGEMIYEKFANVILQTELMNFEGRNQKVLVLLCELELLRNEFAVIAAQFIEPGEKNQNREEVTQNPSDWWSRWSSLIGNVFYERNPYDVIAEMLVVEHLIAKNEKPIWRGPLGSSQDIMTAAGPVEVKSTTKKYGSAISVNSQFQLNQKEQNFRLFFVRLEKNPLGLSVEEMFNKLKSLGEDPDTIYTNIERSGIHQGSSLWKEKFEVLEKRMYQVGHNFPVIEPASFVGGQIPNGIIKIQYEVDLDSQKYEIW